MTEKLSTGRVMGVNTQSRVSWKLFISSASFHYIHASLVGFLRCVCLKKKSRQNKFPMVVIRIRLWQAWFCVRRSGLYIFENEEATTAARKLRLRHFLKVSEVIYVDIIPDIFSAYVPRF